MSEGIEESFGQAQKRAEEFNKEREREKVESKINELLALIEKLEHVARKRDLEEDELAQLAKYKETLSLLREELEKLTESNEY